MIDERDLQTLLRRLAGELTPEEEWDLDARLGAEPALRAAADRLEGDWRGLDLPPAPAPAGFADAAMRRIGAAEPEAPLWARLAAAAALAAGIALGAALARVPPDDLPADELAGSGLPTLAERYVSALEELDREVGE